MQGLERFGCFQVLLRLQKLPKGNYCGFTNLKVTLFQYAKIMVFCWYYFSAYEREHVKQETVCPSNCVLWVGEIGQCYPTIQIQHFVHYCSFFFFFLSNMEILPEQATDRNGCHTEIFLGILLNIGTVCF